MKREPQPHLSTLAGVLLAMLLLAAPSSGRYIPPPLADLIGASDLVVLGEISSVSEHTFMLDIEEILHGSESRQTIEIVRFKDWTCSSRWSAYAVGQRVIAFLDTEERPYRLRSPGSEAELHVVGDDVILHATYLTPEQWAVPSAGKIPLRHVRSAIKDFAQCFHFDVLHGIYSVKQLCDDEVLAIYRLRSAFHEKVTASALWLLDAYSRQTCTANTLSDSQKPSSEDGFRPTVLEARLSSGLVFGDRGHGN